MTLSPAGLTPAELPTRPSPPPGDGSSREGMTSHRPAWRDRDLLTYGPIGPILSGVSGNESLGRMRG